MAPEQGVPPVAATKVGASPVASAAEPVTDFQPLVEST